MKKASSIQVRCHLYILKFKIFLFCMGWEGDSPDIYFVVISLLKEVVYTRSRCAVSSPPPATLSRQFAMCVCRRLELKQLNNAHLKPVENDRSMGLLALLLQKFLKGKGEVLKYFKGTFPKTWDSCSLPYYI